MSYLEQMFVCRWLCPNNCTLKFQILFRRIAPPRISKLVLKFPEDYFYFCYYLEETDPLKLYPAVERVEKKRGSEFSIICTTESMRSYSSKFNWFKNNNVLPNGTNVAIRSTFLKLGFTNLRVEDTGIYKGNITDGKNIEEKSFQLIVFGKWFTFCLLLIQGDFLASK